MRTYAPTDPHAPSDPTLTASEVEPSLTAMGTFAAGQSARGEYHVAAEAEVGSFARGLTTADRPRQG